MKKLIYLLFIIICISCAKSDRKTIEWVEKAEKPIIVIESIPIFTNNNRYTLISTGGEIHETGDTKLSFPDTIK